ncbi:hypothetical protein [Marinobacterium mangrovicola]|uniref:Uncharacterized protein n=1 Tax=Marinobacterium mangrovicola TaxID=1476959 RepID=A0A4R1GF40_9GAMM|nr:hypothetical protein [Marinobacterium mangrovicola]TCK06967.1 hypothetical protein CLV83_1817 [Marinobacterium mangrovicola]
MAKGFFPKQHWVEVLAHLDSDSTEPVEIELNQYGVIVDHTMVSFITDTDKDILLEVERAGLLKSDFAGLVVLEYRAPDCLRISDETAGQSVDVRVLALKDD